MFEILVSMVRHLAVEYSFGHLVNLTIQEVDAVIVLQERVEKLSTMRRRIDAAYDRSARLCLTRDDRRSENAAFDRDEKWMREEEASINLAIKAILDRIDEDLKLDHAILRAHDALGLTASSLRRREALAIAGMLRRS